MRLPVGQSDFASIIDSHFDFVDKSLFINDIINDDQIILITRPRRFGKTLNLSMLSYFFDLGYDLSSNHALFKHLAISQHGNACLKHQGKYAVISLSFKDIKGATFSAAYVDVCNIIKLAYIEHGYLLESNALTTAEKTVYQAILARGTEPVDIKESLKTLTRYLYKHHGSKVVVLVDEYDTPIQSGYLNGYYEEITDFFRGFLGAGLKDNKYIFKAVLTGILRVAKENLFSGLNNLTSYSMLDEQYSAYFGFTEMEVEAIIKQAKLSDQLDKIKAWYNGYQAGSQIIYNPWSIANYVKMRKLKLYWVNTSDNKLVKSLLINSSADIKDDLNALMNGNFIKHIIDDGFVFADLKNNDTAIWSMMFMAGYLKAGACEETDRGTQCSLSIPNNEIRNLYRKIVETWLANGRNLEWYDRFIGHLLDGDIESFSKDLQSIMDQIVSVHDTAKDAEAFYHGLMIGLTASLHGDKNYELRSNRESGDGRYDYIIISRDPNRFSLLMEFKKAEPNALRNSAKAALQQIHTKNYAAEIQQRDIKKLLTIGIAFHGKNFVLESC